MANIRSVYELFKEYGIPIIIDACRILENAWFIREREPGYGARSLKDIVREFCSYANVCTMSATKDFYVDSGGFLATSNEELYHRFMDMIMIVGDGLSVRSKGILNRAISIPFDSEDVITKRVVKSKHLWKKLKRAGIPVVEPECGYGVFIDASPLHKYLQKEEYPEKSFLARLYLESGILGSENFLTPGQKKRDIKMLRFALPIRNYRLSDMDYVAKHVITVWEKADSIRGLRKTYEPPSKAGEFLAHYDLKTDSHMTS
jgi:tyrosine phenol-lyase